ncbi:Crp/Fnr family transcriptional regulator [Bacillus thuringiensis]|uniref:Transcriptional regulator n=1 Tax=Bacillus thuringiensis TaxID=1428 RepID=A0A9X6Q3X2_BACTU|nr:MULTISPECIES: Crp/Fnr family transcriptional regulator [Bacillus cereus group]MDA2615894.1 Crp/Fnr family transcriptional regulator [Bacillus cereus]MEB8556177.1 Crp/Fnr family transcriptional regulator [Bacillus cereus]MEB8729316.1 Crp/Fnr family transcriptional regulator [Bacillus cereus]MEB8822857.1 Crp/Fnr family transcriptional regulator [Bacillus cereus]MEB8976586.1 Crp/Fnr family transcriptional regulator [Bacillus cereus]
MNQNLFRSIYHYTFTRDLISFLSVSTFQPNEFILKAGDKIDGLYFLLSGRYMVSNLEVTGKELLLRYCQQPAIMGDIEIFADCLVESNCIAVKACEVLFVLLELYEAHLKFDSKFNQLLLKELAYKLRTCTISSRVNALSPVSVRLAAYLCTVESQSLLNQYIKTNSLDDVASLIGTTKRHLNRILKNWKEDGIIKREENRIQILNMDKIKEISENVRFE